MKDDAIPSLFSYGPEAKKPRYQANIAFSDEGIEKLVLVSLLRFYYESNIFAHLSMSRTRFELRGSRDAMINNGFMVTNFRVHPPSFKIYYAGFTWKIMAS